MANPSADTSVSFSSSSLVREVAEKLLARRQTVAFAESCTGGRVAAMLTTYAGISSVFRGAVVSYANEAKQDLLGVQQSTLAKHGAVSPQTALEMAIGARRALKSDWAVAITGIAGPGGGTLEKPVGLVYFGISGPSLEMRMQTSVEGNAPQHIAETAERHFEGDRTKIQQAAADHALAWLSRHLGEAKSGTQSETQNETQNETKGT